MPRRLLAEGDEEAAFMLISGVWSERRWRLRHQAEITACCSLMISLMLAALGRAAPASEEALY